MKKYKLTEETKIHSGVTLYRIEALKDFAHVAAGDKGGWIADEENLSRDGDAWVSCDAQVSGNALVSDDAQVSSNAQVSGDAWVSGNAYVYGDAQVSGNAYVFGAAQVSGDALVTGDAKVSGNAKVSGKANITLASHCLVISPIGSERGELTAYKTLEGIEATRGCFSGTLEEFTKAVEETHGGNKHGKAYKAAIELIKIQLSNEVNV